MTCIGVSCTRSIVGNKGLYLQVVGGFEQHTCHQVGVSPQVVDTLLRVGAEHLHTLS